jgi:hypothetical protein
MSSVSYIGLEKFYVWWGGLVVVDDAVSLVSYSGLVPVVFFAQIVSFFGKISPLRFWVYYGTIAWSYTELHTIRLFSQAHDRNFSGVQVVQ